MVADTRKLEAALGTGSKGIEDNELETIVLQRRCVRAQRDISAGEILTRSDVEVLRPAPPEAIPAHEVALTVGRTANRPISSGEHLSWSDLT